MTNPYAPISEPAARSSQVARDHPRSASPSVAGSAWPDPPRREAFHGIAGQIAQSVAERSEADPAGVLATVLAIVGAVSGRGRLLHHGTPHGANEFVVLVGESSVGRKGTTHSIVSTLFDAAAPDWKSIVVPGLGSGEGLIQHLKEKEGVDERALVLETEMGRLLRVMDRQGSTLSPILRNAWDGASLGRFLSRGGMVVHRHHIGCLAHITPVELRERLTDVDAANGFGNRFLWICVRRPRSVPFPEPSDELVAPYVATVEAILDFARTPGAIAFSAVARDRWSTFYLSLQAAPGLTGALLARAEAHVLRLALTYAILDRSEVIDVVHLSAARALWDYSAASVRWIFGETTGNEKADDLLRILQLEGPQSKSQLRTESNIRNGASLQKAIECLVEQGKARTWWGESTAKGGRPPLMVEAT